jgi:UDP-glucose 4-epimerase
MDTTKKNIAYSQSLSYIIAQEEEEMLILVTGASGRIGRNLVAELLKKGHRVRALVLPGEVTKLRDWDLECIEGKLEDPAIYDELLDGVEAVYHLGALLPANVTNEQIFQVNIRGTYNMLEAIAEHGLSLKRFVFASSDEVYPSLKPKYLPLDEYHPHEPYSIYGLSKAFGEDLCGLYFRESGIPVVCPRFTFTIEARELLDPLGVSAGLFYVRRKLELLRRVRNPGAAILEQIHTFEDLYQKNGESLFISYDEKGAPYEMTICDVRDLVQGLLLVLENDKAVGEAFGFGPPSSFPFDEMVKYLSKRTGLPWAEVRLKESLPCKFRLNLSKARAYLGYTPKWDIFSMIDDAVQQRDVK